MIRVASSTRIDVCDAAVCSGGIVRAGVEAHDDGNADNTDGCLNTCRVATCGDGVVEAGVEACDAVGCSGGSSASSARHMPWL